MDRCVCTNAAAFVLGQKRAFKFIKTNREAMVQRLALGKGSREKSPDFRPQKKKEVVLEAMKAKRLSNQGVAFPFKFHNYMYSAVVL